MARVRTQIDPRGLADYLKDRDVVLVGPSGALEGSGRGAEIDAFDVVVRLNWSAPVPLEHRADFGARTDVLYKRLLTPQFPTRPELESWELDGVRWVVVSEATAQSTNAHRFMALNAGALPWTITGDMRSRLLRETKSPPLIGLMAIAHLLAQPIRSLTVVNCDFYAGGYYAGYGGKQYRQAMHREEGHIAPTHDAPVQLRKLHELWQSDRRLKLDAPLQRMVTGAVRRHAAADAVAIIPARYESSRFPGKPLAEILGKPMILHVCEAVATVLERVIVATDDERIASVVRDAGFEAIITPEAMTGTDRVQMVARQVDARVIVNVQGDEPLVDPADVLALVVAKKSYPNEVINGMCRLEGDPWDRTVVKAVTGPDGRLLYASRLPVPGTKEGTVSAHWKQLGLYAFTRRELEAFAKPGARTPAEATEDVEILRFLEVGVPVRMIELHGSAQAVDLPEHVAIVEEAIRVRDAAAVLETRALEAAAV